jgi:hypothetical protein
MGFLGAASVANYLFWFLPFVPLIVYFQPYFPVSLTFWELAFLYTGILTRNIIIGI